VPRNEIENRQALGEPFNLHVCRPILHWILRTVTARIRLMLYACFCSLLPFRFVSLPSIRSFSLFLLFPSAQFAFEAADFPFTNVAAISTLNLRAAALETNACATVKICANDNRCGFGLSRTQRDHLIIVR